MKNHMITMRPPCSGDKTIFLNAMTASQSLHHPWVSPPLTPQAFDEYVKRSQQENQQSYLIFDNANHLVGVFNLNEIVRGTFQNAFLGFYGVADFTHQGLMSAGLKLVLKHAFQDLGLHRIEANIQPNNAQSLNFIKKAGFRYEGFSPRYLKINGEWCDHEHWVMTEEEYLNDPMSTNKENSYSSRCQGPYQTEKLFFEKLKKNHTLTEVNIEKIRQLNKTLSCFVDSPADLLFRDLFINCKAGHTLKLRYYSIDDQIRPLIIYLPGNGFCYDLFIENCSIISKIAKTSGCHAIAVEYRLAPESPYPAPLEDAFEAFYFIMNHLDRFRANQQKIILSGYSSGANLAAVITNKMNDDKKHQIFHQLLISGAYDYTNSLHDYDEYAIYDELLSLEEIKFSIDGYSKKSQRKEPSCSPYWSKNLSDLPNTTIVVAEYDGGRSQSEGYADKLIKSGNKVTKILLPGQTHGTILYRKALSEGKDPSLVIGEHIRKIVEC